MWSRQPHLAGVKVVAGLAPYFHAANFGEKTHARLQKPFAGLPDTVIPMGRRYLTQDPCSFSPAVRHTGKYQRIEKGSGRRDKFIAFDNAQRRVLRNKLLPELAIPEPIGHCQRLGQVPQSVVSDSVVTKQSKTSWAMPWVARARCRRDKRYQLHSDRRDRTAYHRDATTSRASPHIPSRIAVSATQPSDGRGNALRPKRVLNERRLCVRSRRILLQTTSRAPPDRTDSSARSASCGRLTMTTSSRPASLNARLRQPAPECVNTK